MTAIMPTQVRKPKQKASAEGAVKDAAAWAIARLRSRVFAYFDEVAAAVRGCLDEHNARPFQKREESRDGVISEVEALQLRPLPSVRYDVAQWACDRAREPRLPRRARQEPLLCPITVRPSLCLVFSFAPVLGGLR